MPATCGVGAIRRALRHDMAAGPAVLYRHGQHVRCSDHPISPNDVSAGPLAPVLHDPPQLSGYDVSEHTP